MNTEKIFRFSLPTEIIFGIDAVKKIGQEAKKIGANLLLVTDENLKKAGLLEKVLQPLEDEKLGVALAYQETLPEDKENELKDKLIRKINSFFKMCQLELHAKLINN